MVIGYVTTCEICGARFVSSCTSSDCPACRQGMVEDIIDFDGALADEIIWRLLFGSDDL